jgi:hypothetical protein
VPRDSLAEALVTKIRKVLRRLLRVRITVGFDKAEQTLANHRRRQPKQIGLKRIAGQHPARKNPRLAIHLQQRATGSIPRKQLANQSLDAGVAQVQPVSGLVEVKSVAALGASMTTGAGVLLEQLPGNVSGQMAGPFRGPLTPPPTINTVSFMTLGLVPRRRPGREVECLAYRRAALTYRIIRT